MVTWQPHLEGLSVWHLLFTASLWANSVQIYNTFDTELIKYSNNNMLTHQSTPAMSMCSPPPPTLNPLSLYP